MKVVIDTNSLLSLVRYYLPFDKKQILFDFIKYKVEIGEIIIIDKILEEAEYLAKGLIMKELPFLKDKHFLKSANLPRNTEFILPPAPAKFLRQVDNQFVNRVMRKELTETQYDNRKTTFMNSADMRLILFSLNLQKSNPLFEEEIYLVTEETEDSNDSKLFKKIPAICKEIGITTISLPQMLSKFEKIDIEFKK